MLQGSSNRILMSKINGRCNFFIPILFTYYFEWRLLDCSCFFVFKVWNTSLIFCPPSCAIFFCPIVGIPHFVVVKISWFIIFFCVTHCVHFFLSHLVQLLFCMVPHWPHVFIFDLILHFYTIVCSSYFDCCTIKGFYQIFLQSYFAVSQWANCFLPHRAKFLFWMVPHRAHLYNSFSDGG